MANTQNMNMIGGLLRKEKIKKEKKKGNDKEIILLE